VNREPLDTLTANAYRPYLPTRGFLSSIGGGWRLAKGKAHGTSISPEDARLLSFVGKLSSPLLGSHMLDDQDEKEPFGQLQVTGEWREYRSLPWLHNHVLALKAAGGASFGDSQRYGSYRLGGSHGESAYYTLPDEWRSLRGFPVAAVYGDWYYLSSLEYRAPLLWLDKGLNTYPFFLRYISGAAFIDAGNAFDGPEDEEAGQARIGAGAELQASMVVGWGMGLRVRAGYAFALRGEGHQLGSPNGFYAWLGSSF